MSEPFLAEIRMVGFNFAPRGWSFCDGQILPINQNQSLYSLLGTTYGGDGRTSFALPDLRSRTPIHVSDNHNLGQRSGSETVTLSVDEMGQHKHAVQGVTDDVDAPLPNGAYWGSNLDLPYAAPVVGNDFAGDTVGDTGGGVGHDNMQPWLALSFCIALQGLFPSRN